MYNIVCVNESVTYLIVEHVFLSVIAHCHIFSRLTKTLTLTSFFFKLCMLLMACDDNDM